MTRTPWTRRHWLAIGLLAGGAAVYLLLGVYLAQRQSTAPDLNADSPGALAWFDRLLAPLAPRLPLDGLRCDDQPLDQPLVLTPAAPACQVQVSAEPADRFWRTELVVAALNPVKPPLYIRADYDGAALERSPPPADCIPLDADTRMPASWIGVVFEPEDAPTPITSCWLPAQEPRRLQLTLLEPTRIQLRCQGCEQKVSLIFR